MNYLPIQALSVPSERVFLSSSKTNTKRHNRILPDIMEALQILKFTLKKDQLNFIKGWVTQENMLHEASKEGVDLFMQLLEWKEDVIDEIIEGIANDSKDENIM